MADPVHARQDFDLLVVGGGPAGLAAAIAARQAGLERVRVVEQQRPPIDKACGEGLMPDAVVSLRSLGVDLTAVGYPLRGIRYIDGATVAEGRFPDGAHGLGVRRPRLHQALVERAEQLGVELAWGLRAGGLLPGGRGIETPRGPLTARFLIAADGLNSKLRRMAGLDRDLQPLDRRRVGRRRHFRIAPWCGRVEVYWADGCEAYVTPVAADLVGVAILGPIHRHPSASEMRSRPAAAAPFDRMLDEFPGLARRLAGAPAMSNDRGAGPLARQATAVTRGRLALIGDASGYIDAITGEGLALAFHQASALGEALAAGDLTRYARAHRRIARLPGIITRLMLVAERHPAVRRRLIRTLATEGALFSRLLAIHARLLPARRLGPGGAFRLVRGLMLG